MAWRVGNKALIDRIYQLFSWEKLSQEPLLIADRVFLTADLRDFDTEPMIQTTTGATTARTDTYTVPAGRFWHVNAIQIVRANTGINSFIFTCNGTAVTFAYATAVSQAWTTPFNLKEGDSIQCVMAAGTSGALDSYVFYDETKA